MGYFIFQRSRMVTSFGFRNGAPHGAAPWRLPSRAPRLPSPFRPNQCWALLGAWSCRERASPTLDRTLVTAPSRSIRVAGWSDICARVRAHPTQMPHATRRGDAASYSPSCDLRIGAVFAAAHVKPDIGLTAQSQREHISTS